jgi:ABC-type polar amino acid transport system ATPase subunit
MANETVEVKLYDVERVYKLTELLNDYPDDTQSALDLTMLALILAEVKGVDKEDMLSTITEQYKIARKVAPRVTTAMKEESE